MYHLYGVLNGGQERQLALHQLKSSDLRSITTPGLHADGGGLYLKVTPKGTRSWVLRYQIHGRRRSMGLGSIRDIGLAVARERARGFRELIAQGIDPLDRRQEAKPAPRRVPTFREMAANHIRDREAGWSNAKHSAQWTSTLQSYAFPVIGDLPVDQVDTQHILDILRPIWTTKAETAKRVRGRIEAILDAAKVLGHREGQNPAAWRGHLALLLPAKSKVAPVKHFEALPFQQAPKFMLELRQRQGFAVLALEFLILTAARTSDVLGARWDEIDGTRWVIPSERMKSRRSHAVPLSKEAQEVLTRARKNKLNMFLFPGRNGQMSNMTMAKLLKTIAPTVTVHGFRSTFRDWAAETTAHQADVVEMALAHVVSDKTEAAYRRGDLFEKRRVLMNDWASFLETTNSR